MQEEFSYCGLIKSGFKKTVLIEAINQLIGSDRKDFIKPFIRLRCMVGLEGKFFLLTFSLKDQGQIVLTKGSTLL